MFRQKKSGFVRETIPVASPRSNVGVSALDIFTQEDWGGNHEGNAPPTEDKMAGGVKQLLKWAKSMKEDADVNTAAKIKQAQVSWETEQEKEIILVEKGQYKDFHHTFTSSKFQVTHVDEAQTFQVRKVSVIKPPSETVVTRHWLENAICCHEHESSATLVSMKFDNKDDGSYHAKLEANVGDDNRSYERSYRWIIKATPEEVKEDKDTFMVSDLGLKFQRFLIKMYKKKKIRMDLPFQSVIFADNQYAIFDDVKNYHKASNANDGFNTSHLKTGLKALAKLHALSYAYFEKADDDVGSFTKVLSLMIDPPYQPSASVLDKEQAKQDIVGSVSNLASVLQSMGLRGAEYAAKLVSKYKANGLYSIYKKAHTTNSKFSVLCHGFPTTNAFRFLYKDGMPNDAILVNFKQARYASAMTDVQVMLASSVSPKNENQGEFLLRYVYYETLVSILKSLGIEDVIGFDELHKEFKVQEEYGCLEGAIHLSSLVAMPSKRTPLHRTPSTGKHTFYSRILGGVIGTGEVTPTNNEQTGQASEETSPQVRALSLIKRILK